MRLRCIMHMPWLSRLADRECWLERAPVTWLKPWLRALWLKAYIGLSLEGPESPERPRGAPRDASKLRDGPEADVP